MSREKKKKLEDFHDVTDGNPKTMIKRCFAGAFSETETDRALIIGLFEQVNSDCRILSSREERVLNDLLKTEV